MLLFRSTKKFGIGLNTRVTASPLRYSLERFGGSKRYIRLVLLISGVTIRFSADS